MASPSGAYRAGFANLAYCDPSVSGASALEVDPEKHLVGAVFYPTEEKCEGASFARARWTPYYGYSQGFANFTLRFLAGASSSWLNTLKWALVKPVFAPSAYLLGHSMQLPAYKIAADNGPLPVILLSHGVGGNRMVQSCLCCELASQGFVVLSIEHADGSASAAHLAGAYKPEWLFFQEHDALKREHQIIHRLKELKTALRLLASVNEGRNCPGLKFTDAPAEFLASLRSSLDLGCIATIGHSFGGGPACALPAEDGYASCGIGLDPYWPPLPAQHPVYQGFCQKSSLLMIGSQSWNDPKVRSGLKTDAAREEAVVSAASSSKGGGGSITLVMRGIGHASFTDADLLFGSMVPKLAMRSNPKDALQPNLAIALLNEVMLTFLETHMPLTEAQRSRIDTSGPTRALGKKGECMTRSETVQHGQQNTPIVTEGLGADLPSRVDSATEAALPHKGAGSEPTASDSSAAGDWLQGTAPRVRVGAGVSKEEASILERILGKDNIFSLKIVC